ncbi:MAG: tetratricopeptide repeat protein [Methanobacteriota archaeon]
MLVLLVGLVLAPAALAAASPLSGELAWDEAVALGESSVEGPFWFVQLPMAPETPLGPEAFLTIEGHEVVVREEWREYSGTPVGLVENPSSGLRSSETRLAGARVSLSDLRREAQWLLVADGAADTVALEAVSDAARLRGLREARASLWPSLPGFSPPEGLQREASRSGPALGATVGDLYESLLVSGDFTIHLWDIDLSADGATYRSGMIRTEGPGATGATPNGLAYDARAQLLTIEVRGGGRLVAAFPGRVLEAQGPGDGVSGTVSGSVDLAGATGRLDWGGAERLLADTDLRFAGDVAFRLAASEDGRVASSWSGEARELVAASDPIGAAGSVPVAASGRGTVPLFALGLVLAGGFGTAFIVAKRRAARRLPVDPARLEASLRSGDYESANRTADAAIEAGEPGDVLVAKAIALLKLGRAAEVIESLSPVYDASHESAPVMAYLLSLAHAARGDREAAIEWARDAVALYPGFRAELREHPGFSAIRADPRVRRLLREPGEGPAYA